MRACVCASSVIATYNLARACVRACVRAYVRAHVLPYWWFQCVFYCRDVPFGGSSVCFIAEVYETVTQKNKTNEKLL